MSLKTSKKNKIQQRRIVIGIDPGLANTGWGVLQVQDSRLMYLAHGCIETKPSLAQPERLEKIFNDFTLVLKQWTPQEAGMECLYFAKNAKTALPVAEARGVLSLALQLCAIPLCEYPPRIIKQSVVGTATASKGQVQELVKLILGLSEIPRPDHAADALGAAICRAHELPVLANKSLSRL